MRLIADHLVLLVTILTSLGAAAIAMRLLSLPARALPAALATLMDILGLAVLFTLTNGVLGVLLLLAARHLANHPVSLHRVDDIALYIVSVLQAIALHAWRTTRRTPPPPDAKTPRRLSPRAVTPDD
jgi:hypothetical protein